MKLHYYNSIKNFGDLLNEDMFKILSNTDVNRTSAFRCNIVAIGSLLEKFFTPQQKIFKILAGKFKSPVIVYGTGFIRPPEAHTVLCRRLDIRAVRGYYSLERLKQCSGVKIAENVAVADPGLLVSKLYDTSKIKKKYKLGIIPHYVDRNNPLLKKIKVKDSVILDICSAPSEFTKQLAECEAVISSAMHGLIASDSLGIPNIRMILSDKIVGGDYKFNDYYSAFGIQNHPRIDLNTAEFNEDDLEKMRKNYSITAQQVEKLQNDLLHVYPCTQSNNGKK